MSIATPPTRCPVRRSQRASAMLPWWLGLLATTCAWTRPPTSARSPRMSPALWRTNSSGQRSSPPDQTVVGEHQGRVEVGTLCQPPGPERLRLAHEAEGPRRGQLAGERVRRDVVAPRLAADQRMRPLDRRREAERRRRRHDVGGIALGELERRGDPVDHRIARLVGDARRAQRRQVRAGTTRRRSAAPGPFELDGQIVELERGRRGEQVLHRLDRAGRFAERGAPLGGPHLREPRGHLAARRGGPPAGRRSPAPARRPTHRAVTCAPVCRPMPSMVASRASVRLGIPSSSSATRLSSSPTIGARR